MSGFWPLPLFQSASSATEPGAFQDFESLLKFWFLFMTRVPRALLDKPLRVC